MCKCLFHSGHLRQLCLKKTVLSEKLIETLALRVFVFLYIYMYIYIYICMLSHFSHI